LAGKPDCADIPQYPSIVGEGSGNNLNSSSETGYTCVLVSMKPQTLQYGPVGNTTVTSGQVQTTAAMGTLTINWQADSAAGSCFQPSLSGTGDFRTKAAWTPLLCIAPMLPADVVEVSLTPLAAGGFSRTNLVNNAFHAILYPVKTGVSALPTTTGYAPGSSPVLMNGDCGSHAVVDGMSGNYCTASISGLTGTSYLITMKTVYSSNSNVVLSNGGTGFINSQAVIDSTGKSQDQLKRIQVRVAIGTASSGSAPAPLVGTDGVCKRMQSQPTGTKFFALSGVTADSTHDPACDGATN
jgi:hypothetical protein